MEICVIDEIGSVPLLANFKDNFVSFAFFLRLLSFSNALHSKRGAANFNCNLQHLVVCFSLPQNIPQEPKPGNLY